MKDEKYFTYKVTDKGIDISHLTKEIGFSTPVFINPILWNRYLRTGDGNEYRRVLLILREYIEAGYNSEDDVIYFDIPEDDEFCMYQCLELKAVSKEDGLFIELKFDDIYKLFEKAGLIDV